MNASLLLPCRPEDCDEFLSRPTSGAIEALARLDGPVMLVGAGGKMGPTLAIMAARAMRAAGKKHDVMAVSRFSNAEARALLEREGIRTVSCDLLDRAAVAELPDCPNILFLAGQKFGTSSGPELTWAMNTLVPANVAERFPQSRIVAFSTGCVYAFTTIAHGGGREDTPLDPPGDYANSCVGRERIFQYASKERGTPVCLFRLNYAVDFRYGVLLDVAQKVYAGLPVDVTMGHANVIWQGDANARALQCLEVAASPAQPINITGPETVSIRGLALHFGRLLNKDVTITGTEAPTGWINNAGESFRLFGYPTVCLDQMVAWIAAWVAQGGKTLGKPTHFETRDGKF
jgi:hypothetical protein